MTITIKKGELITFNDMYASCVDVLPNTIYYAKEDVCLSQLPKRLDKINIVPYPLSLYSEDTYVKHKSRCIYRIIGEDLSSKDERFKFVCTNVDDVISFVIHDKPTDEEIGTMEVAITSKLHIKSLIINDKYNNENYHEQIVKLLKYNFLYK